MVIIEGVYRHLERSKYLECSNKLRDSSALKRIALGLCVFLYVQKVKNFIEHLM